MGLPREPTQHLLDRAGRGETSARDELLERYRERLRRSVSHRLDDRLAARLDASDIVQEALSTAARRLDDYLVHRPMPFLDWLKRLARDRIIDAHRTHIVAERRSVAREHARASSQALADHGLNGAGELEEVAYRAERLIQLREALNLLRPADRQIIVMRHLENRSPAQIAEQFGITEGAAKVRTVRALLRLRELLSER